MEARCRRRQVRNDLPFYYFGDGRSVFCTTISISTHAMALLDLSVFDRYPYITLSSGHVRIVPTKETISKLARSQHALTLESLRTRSKPGHISRGFWLGTLADISWLSKRPHDLMTYRASANLLTRYGLSIQAPSSIVRNSHASKKPLPRLWRLLQSQSMNPNQNNRLFSRSKGPNGLNLRRISRLYGQHRLLGMLDWNLLEELGRPQARDIHAEAPLCGPGLQHPTILEATRYSPSASHETCIVGHSTDNSMDSYYSTGGSTTAAARDNIKDNLATLFEKYRSMSSQLDPLMVRTDLVKQIRRPMSLIPLAWKGRWHI